MFVSLLPVIDNPLSFFNYDGLGDEETGLDEGGGPGEVIRSLVDFVSDHLGDFEDAKLLGSFVYAHLLILESFFGVFFRYLLFAVILFKDATSGTPRGANLVQEV